MFLLLLFSLVNGASLSDTVAHLTQNLTNIRRDFHMYPEIGFDLNRTHQRIFSLIGHLGNFRTVATTGAILDIQGEGPATGSSFILAFRSDMDALHMTEENEDLPWRSKNEGKAHMCGHDGHMTSLIGTAILVSKVKDKIPKNVIIRLFFQPAEEDPGGAQIMIREGTLDGVNEVYAYHYGTPAPFGILNTKPGPIYAHYSGVKIAVHGQGGHSSAPQLTVDPVLVGSHIVVALQTIISRNVEPGHPLVLSICKFHGGEAQNVIPDTVLLEGSTRDFSNDDFLILKKTM